MYQQFFLNRLRGGEPGLTVTVAGEAFLNRLRGGEHHWANSL